METEVVGNSDTSRHTKASVQLNKPCDTVQHDFSSAAQINDLP